MHAEAVDASVVGIAIVAEDVEPHEAVQLALRILRNKQRASENNERDDECGSSR